MATEYRGARTAHPASTYDPAAVARAIVAAGCAGVIRGAEPPITFTAGWRSPVYCDMRQLLGSPGQRAEVLVPLCRLVSDLTEEGLAAVAGGETAGIAWAGLVSGVTGLPMAYVRKAPKGHGLGRRVEGRPPRDQPVYLVDDIMTDGGSKEDFVQALLADGYQVPELVVPVYYDAFPGALEELGIMGVRCHWLVTWQDLLAAGSASGVFSATQVALAGEFLDDPIGWSGAHGGRSE